MFFIGVFGIQDKDKHIGTYNNIVCPACGKLARYEIHKTYRYLHIFFIPTFRWNTRYIVKASCCGSIYELDPFVGREFEKDPRTGIRPENLRRLDHYIPFRYCPDCRIDVPSEFSYCPYCGGRLQQ